MTVKGLVTVAMMTVAAFGAGTDEIYCKHFFYGYPAGTPATNDLNRYITSVDAIEP